MRRPYAAHLFCIMTEKHLTIRCSFAIRRKSEKEAKLLDLPSRPIQSIKLLKRHCYTVRIEGLNSKKEVIYSELHKTDLFGELTIHQNINGELKDLAQFKVYITDYKDYTDLFVGVLVPINIVKNPKLVISDFDKTLVDTKYSSLKEIYQSLTSPISNFPAIPKSISRLKDAIDDGHCPFILSASPHFYENAIREWLNKQNINSCAIYLKDYRDVLSFIDGMLSFRDIKKQGYYKLNFLLDILLMSGIPSSLVLMGDSAESDPMIYLFLKDLLTGEDLPWQNWEKLQGKETFKLTKKQNTILLNKLGMLHSLRENSDAPNDIKVKIQIRETKHTNKNEVLMGRKDEIEWY